MNTWKCYACVFFDRFLMNDRAMDLSLSYGSMVI